MAKGKWSMGNEGKHSQSKRPDEHKKHQALLTLRYANRGPRSPKPFDAKLEAQRALPSGISAAIAKQVSSSTTKTIGKALIWVACPVQSAAHGAPRVFSVAPIAGFVRRIRDKVAIGTIAINCKDRSRDETEK